MKKKSIFSMATLAIAFLVSCSGEKAQEVLLSQSTLEIPEGSCVERVNVTANCEWSTTVSANWLSATRNDDVLILNIQANETYSERAATVTLLSEDKTSSATLDVVQKDNKGILPTGSTEISLKGNTCDFSIELQTNVESLSVKTPDWITQVKSKALSTKTLNFTADENNERKTRQGIIALIGEGVSLKYTVVQAEKEVLIEQIVFEEGKSFVLTEETGYVLTPIFTPDYVTDSELVWLSDNEDILQVNEKGMLTAKGKGEALITATNPKTGKSASVKVDAKIKATFFSVFLQDGRSLGDSKFYPGENVALFVSPIPSFAHTDIYFESSNPDVMAVDGNVIKPNETKIGEADITARDNYSGISITFPRLESKLFYTEAGFVNISQDTESLNVIYGARIYTSEKNRIDVLSAYLAVNGGVSFSEVLKVEKYGPNKVFLTSEKINLTDIFGVYVTQYMPLLQFYVILKFNGVEKRYLIDINNRVQIPTGDW